jgi:transcriptional regulator with XRE-family HTH domain
MASWPIHRLMSDEALLQELGQRIARLRLERNLTQAQLADQAGEHLEAGAAAAQLSLFLRVLRQLDLLKVQQSSRKRASRHRIAAAASTWTRGQRSGCLESSSGMATKDPWGLDGYGAL